MPGDRPHAPNSKVLSIAVLVLLSLAPGCAARRSNEHAEVAAPRQMTPYPPGHLFVLAAVKDLPQGEAPSVACPPWHWASGSVDPSLPFVFSCVTQRVDREQDEDLRRWHERENALCSAFNDLINPQSPSFDAAVRLAWENANDQFADRYFSLNRMPTTPEVEAFALYYFLQTGVLERMSAQARLKVPITNRMPDRYLRPWRLDTSLEDHLDTLSFAAQDDPRKYAGFIQTTRTLCTGLFRIWDGELITPTFGFPQLEACLAAHRRLMKEPVHASAFSGLTDPIGKEAARLHITYEQLFAGEKQSGNGVTIGDAAETERVYREARRALSHQLYLTLEASEIPRRIGIESCSDWSRGSERDDCLEGLARVNQDAAYCTAIGVPSRRETCTREVRDQAPGGGETRAR